MAFIKKRRGNTTYVYETKYESVENGKQKSKWKVIGKLDADGNVIPSKKRASAEAVSLESSLNSQNYSQNSPNVNNNVNDIENNNDTIVTASMNDTAAANIAATATTAITTVADVADNVSDTTHNNMPKPDMMSDTKIDAVYDGTDGTIEAQASGRQIFGTSEDDFISTEYTLAPKTVPSTPEIVDDIVYNLEYVDYEGEASELVNEQEAGESEESSQRNLRNLPQIPGGTAKKVEHFKVSISKPDHIIFDTDKNPQIYEAADIKDVKFTVSGSSSKKKIETLFYIDFNDAKENGITISNEDRINSYDREIYNAVATLAAAGNNEFSPSMIFQLLSGNISDERNKMSPETRRKILKSVEKMSVTRVTIDASAEVRAGMIAQATFKNYLIPAEMTELRINGQLVTDGIRLLSRLPLFDYASRKRQVVSIDIKMLDTPLPNTPENIVLKGYLLMRIASIMNSKNNMSDVIRYQTIYDYLKIQAPTPNALKVKHKQIRDKVKKFLDFWKEVKFIKDYKEEKEGRIFAKIIISCYLPSSQQKTHKKIALHH